MLSFVKNNKQKTLLIILLSFFTIIRGVYVFKPILLGWDASVYVGMGRYISTFGAIGLWEFFRPPLLPMIFSVGGFLHISLIFWSECVTFIAGIVALYMAYRIGERIRPYVGVFALCALGIAPLFMNFSTVPMTEIFGILCSLWILDLIQRKKKPYLIGLSIGVIVLLRFPYGLLLPLLGCFILVEGYTGPAPIKNAIKAIIFYGLGFVTLIGPFLILNQIMYGSPLAPFTAGEQMITGALWLYHHPGAYYAKILFINNIAFLVGSTVFLISLIKEKFSKRQYVFMGLLVLWVMMFLLYFNAQPHREERYIVAAFPALALLAGLGWSYLSKKIGTVATIGLFIVAFAINLSHLDPPFVSVHQKDTVSEFYNYLSSYKKAVVISASPIVTAYSPVNIIIAYDSWKNFETVYHQNRDKADFLLVDSCELHVCTPGDEAACTQTEARVLRDIGEHEIVVYDKMAGQCHLEIAKIKK